MADSSRFDAFDLAERMLTGDAGGSVHSLQRLREEGVEVLELLGALSWNLRQWAQAHATAAQLGDAQRAVEQLRLPRNRQPALLKALRRTRVTQVYGWLRQCARIDQLAKTTHGKEQAWEEMLALVLAKLPSMVEISTQCETPERTLQHYFLRELGCTPIAYLRTMRLHRVRATLLSADRSQRNITKIATDYGFVHLSRFAAQYQKLFGELPSETLTHNQSKPTVILF